MADLVHRKHRAARDVLLEAYRFKRAVLLYEFGLHARDLHVLACKVRSGEYRGQQADYYRYDKYGFLFHGCSYFIIIRVVFEWL